jgi:hypothetical protein
VPDIQVKLTDAGSVLQIDIKPDDLVSFPNVIFKAFSIVKQWFVTAGRQKKYKSSLDGEQHAE